MLPFIELAQLSPVAPVPGRLETGVKLKPAVVPFIELAQLSLVAPAPGRLQTGVNFYSILTERCPLHRIGPIKPHHAPLHRIGPVLS